MTLRDLCQEMHACLRELELCQKERALRIGRPSADPADDAARRVPGAREEPSRSASRSTELEGRVVAVGLVPYPPGIPVLMPGEEANAAVCDYLQGLEAFDDRFPGFEHEIHGLGTPSELARRTGVRAAIGTGSTACRSTTRGRRKGDARRPRGGPRRGLSTRRTAEGLRVLVPVGLRDVRASRAGAADSRTMLRRLCASAGGTSVRSRAGSFAIRLETARTRKSFALRTRRGTARRARRPPAVVARTTTVW